MKFYFIAPPRKYWPYINEYDNFMLPLWMACLAGVAREKAQVRCIDCMAEKIGWKSLEKILESEQPEIIAISESHALFMPEQAKLIELIKKVCPSSLLMAGGGHYSNQVKESLERYPLDLICIGEGEETLKDILEDPKNYRRVKGLAYKNENNEIIFTPPRPLIHDLDKLPLPAWDLLPMESYGNSKYLFSPSGTCIEHGRGCICSCDFCAWWTNMAERELHEGEFKLRPKWRTKSPERTFEELKVLVEKYHKKYFVFVDGTWNVDPQWSRRFSELVIESGLTFQWMAFMRADLLIRDERLGVLEKMVQAGLTHVLVGLEHSCQEVLEKDYNKNNQNVNEGREVLKIFKTKYPQVFVQGTFIVGGPNESEASLLNLASYIKELKLDYTSIHILTPVPGTAIFNKLVTEGVINELEFEKMDWNTPLMPTKHLSKEDLSLEVYKLNKKIFTLSWTLRLFLSPYKYKRAIGIWGLMVSLKVFWDSLGQILSLKRKMFDMVTPEWYDS